jgi:uncharacterized membrane protein
MANSTFTYTHGDQMNTHCSTASFTKGMKTISESLSSYLRNGGARHMAISVLMGLALGLGMGVLFSLLHALIMTLGMAKIELLNLPIDTAGESIWPGYMLQQEHRLGSTRKIFEHGTSAFALLFLAISIPVGCYLACKRICKMGQTGHEASA